MIIRIVILYIVIQTHGILSQERIKRAISPFNKVEIMSGLDVYLKQDTIQSIEIVCNKEYLKRIQSVVTDSLLTIRSNQVTRWTKGNTPKIYLSFINIEQLIAINNSDVYGISAFRLDKLSIHTQSGSDVHLTLNCGTLRINSKNGSNIKLNGKTQNLDATIDGGSDFNSVNMPTDHCTILASGGSEVVVYCAESINAQANDGSKIGYMGNPKDKKITEKGSSEIYRK